MLRLRCEWRRPLERGPWNEGLVLYALAALCSRARTPKPPITSHFDFPELLCLRGRAALPVQAMGLEFSHPVGLPPDSTRGRARRGAVGAGFGFLAASAASPAARQPGKSAPAPVPSASRVASAHQPVWVEQCGIETFCLESFPFKKPVSSRKHRKKKTPPMISRRGLPTNCAARHHPHVYYIP